MFHIQTTQRSDTEPGRVARNRPHSALNMRTIHVVDDSAEDAHFVQRVLNIIYPACHITHFVSGHDYLKSDRRTPDLLLIDVNMPGISGIDTYHALANRDVIIPTYFISGHTHSIGQQQLFSVGVRGLLIKELGVMQTACLWKYHLSLDEVYNG